MKSKKAKASALKVLEGAYRIIKDPNKWIQDDEAIDAQGDRVDPTDKNAVRFCSLGAMNKIDGPALDEALRLLRKVAEQICIEQGITLDEDENDSIITVNDYTTEDGGDLVARVNVLNMFQRAILLAKLEKR